MPLKGAFINLGAGLLGALPNIVIFQFNPLHVTHTPALVQPPTPETGSGARDATQQPGQPSESYSFSLRLDATDQLASSNPIAAASGILPALSALELLLVPKSGLSIDLFKLSGDKKPHQHPPERLPTILFFWGPFRILPVTAQQLEHHGDRVRPNTQSDSRRSVGEFASADSGSTRQRSGVRARSLQVQPGSEGSDGRAQSRKHGGDGHQRRYFAVF